MRFPLLFSVLTLLTVAACAPAPGPARAVDPTALPADASPLVACGTSRPQVCTMIYAPVCAHYYDGRLETQASGCNACADDTVAAYLDGPCTEEIAQ